MTIKFTNFYTLNGQGWGESAYLNSDDLDLANRVAARNRSLRLALMTVSCNAVGVRLQQIADRGLVVSSKISGVLGTFTAGLRDVTNVAALYKGITANNLKRQIWLRGVPDEMVVSGAFAFVGTYASLVTAWRNDITASNHCLLAPNRAENPLQDVATVAADGTVTLFSPVTWVKGDVLQFYRGKDSLGKTIRGRFRIGAVTNTTNYILTGWDAGRTAINVRVRRLVFAPYPIVGLKEIDITTRKSGRPFGLRPGRRSARK